MLQSLFFGKDFKQFKVDKKKGLPCRVCSKIYIITRSKSGGSSGCLSQQEKYGLEDND